MPFMLLQGVQASYIVEDSPSRQGGQAEVYRGRRSDNTTSLAFKVARRRASSKAWMDQERQALEQAGRRRRPSGEPWVVPILDHGITKDGSAFLVMPWYPWNFRDWLNRENPSVRTRIHALLLVAEAAIEFQRSGSNHAHVLIHRDLKLDNILVREVGGKLEVVLADLGSSKHARLGIMSGNTVIYTPGYAPLEQRFPLLTEPDRSVDAHALAVTIYEALTGLLPQTMLGREGLINNYGQRFGSLARKQQRTEEEEAEYQEMRSRPIRAFLNAAPEPGLYTVDRDYLLKQLVQSLRSEYRNAESIGMEICDKLLPTLSTAMALLPEDRRVELVDIYGGLESARQSVDHATPTRAAPARPQPAASTAEEQRVSGETYDEPSSAPVPMVVTPAPAVPPPRTPAPPAVTPRGSRPAVERTSSLPVWIGGTAAAIGLLLALVFGISSSSYFEPLPPETPALVLPDRSHSPTTTTELAVVTPTAPTHGTLSISVIGGQGRIYINGKAEGSSPKTLNLSGGSYEVQVRNTAIGLDWRQTVKVVSGEVKKLTIDPDAAQTPSASATANPCDTFDGGVRLLLSYKEDGSTTTTMDGGISGLANRMTHLVPPGKHLILLSPQDSGHEPVQVQAQVQGCTIRLSTVNGGCTGQLQAPEQGRIQAVYSRKASLSCN